MKNNYSNQNQKNSIENKMSFSSEANRMCLSSVAYKMCSSSVAEMSLSNKVELSIRNSTFAPPKAAAKLILNSKFLTLIFSILFFLGVSLNGWGQVGNYTFSTGTSGTLNAMTSSTQLVAASSDDVGSAVTNIGFTFVFNNTSYTQFSASSNGLMRLGGTAVGTVYSNGTATSASAWYASTSSLPLIAPYWDDLATGVGGKVHTVITGTAPNRIRIVEWFVTVPRNTGGNAAARFQCWLYESTNVVEFRYGAGMVTNTTNSGASIGIANASSGANNMQSVTVSSNTSSLTTYNPLNTDAIASGRTYTFTPPPAPTISGISPGSGCPGTSLTITGTNFTNASAVSIGGTAATSFSVTNSTTITAIVGAGATGTVQVTTPGGAATSPSTFTVSTAPAAPTASAATAITSTSATANWASVAGATSYRLDVSTSNTFATFVTGYDNLNVGSVTSASITGLTANTTYFYRVRGNNGSCSGVSSGTITFTTSCAGASIPWTEGFETGYTNNTSMGGCWSQSSIAGAQSWTANSSATSYNRTPRTGSFNAFLRWSNDDWLFYPVQLTGGTNYTFEVYARQDGATSTDANITLAYGSSASSGSMTTITGPTGIINGNYQSISGTFTPASSGVYYMGIKGYMNGTPYYISIDDISVTVTPSCAAQPSALTSSVTSSTTATLSWTAASPAPGSGYEYFVSTSATAPTAGTTPTGSTAAGVTTANLTGLTASTTYYFWVRSNCGGTDETSSWAGSNTFYTGYCASTSSSSNYFISNFTTTSGLTNISNATSYSTSGYGNFSSQEISNYVGASTSYTVTWNTTGGVGFGAWIDWNNDLDFNDANETIYVTSSYNFTTSYSGTITIPLGTAIGNYRMRIKINYDSNAPTSCGTISNGETEDYTFTVAVQPDPITITPFGSTTFCNGNSVDLTASSTAAYTYTWSPSTGLNTTSGATVIANPTTTTTYTVTGNNGAGMIGTQTITITVNPAPTEITIQSTINGTDACNQNYVELSVTGNNAVAVFEEGFETNPVTKFNLQASGSGEFYDEPYFTEGSSAISLVGAGDIDFSNGNTRITLANSIDLSQYASATLTFDHICASEATYDFGYVQYSLDAGSNWIDFPTSSYSGSGTLKNGVVSFDKSSYSDWNAQFTSDTSTPGTAPATALFKSESINLNAFMNNTNFRIRFRLSYDDSNDYYGWIIDNVKINIVPKVTWSPITNLFTDTALTTAYTTGTNAATVYALPNGVQNYTATATIGSCTKTDTETVTNYTKRYVGTNGGSWDVINSWLPTGIPTIDNCVKIPTGKSVIVSGSTAIANTLTIESNTATITVNSDGILKLNNTLTNLGTGSNAIFENNSSLIQINNVTNTGNISYNRTSPQTVLNTDYVYWASPVSGQNVPSTGLNYFWNNAAGTSGNWVNASGQALTAGKGVIMRGIASRNFTGVPFNGEITVAVHRRNIADYNDNWNLIGNPYPSAISAEEFLRDLDNTAIEGSIAIWTHGSEISNSITTQPFYGNFTYNYNPNDYIIYNLTGPQSGIETYQGFIPAGQGFFVKYDNDDNASPTAASSTIKFKNSMRSDASGNAYNNTQFYRNSGNVSQNIEKSRIWIDIINGSNAFNRTLVGYIENATDGKDRLYDSTTSVTSTSTSIYSLIGNDKMCIQAKGLPFNNSDIIPLGYNASQAGNYTIAIHALDGLFVNQNVYLYDAQLNITHDIKVTPYTFTATQGENNSRFQLIFNNETLSNPDFDSENAVFLINKDNLKVVSAIENIEEIKVFDLLGRTLYINNHIDNKEFEIPVSQEKVALIVKIKLANGIYVERKTMY